MAIENRQTTVRIDELFENPNLFLFDYEGSNALFVEMDREGFRQSSFLDSRAKRAGDKVLRIPAGELSKAFGARPSGHRNLCFLFNIGFCGSTLMSRALELSERAIVYKEPMALATVAVHESTRDREGSGWEPLFHTTLSLLSKAYAGQDQVVLKPTVPANFIIPELMELNADNRAVAMYLTLDEFLLKALREAERRQWVRIELCNRARQVKRLFDADVGQIRDWPAPIQAACFWALQITSLQEAEVQFPKCLSLDGQYLFENPAKTVMRTFEHFGLPTDTGIADEERLNSLLSTYSKNPELNYDPDRVQRQKTALRHELEQQIGQAHEWLRPRIGELNLQRSMSRPLIGESPELLTF